jgi:hypothetical protein
MSVSNCANPAIGGDYRRNYRLEAREIGSARECLEPRGDPDETFEVTLQVDGVVYATLQRLFAGLAIGDCRYPVHLLGLAQVMVDVLIRAGVPQADLCLEIERSIPRDSAALDAAVPEVVALQEIVTQAAQRYGRQTDRIAIAELPAGLIRVYRYLRPLVGRTRQLRVRGSTLILGRLPISDEYVFALDPEDKDTLVVSKRPVWPGEFPALKLNLSTDEVLERVWLLTRGYEWSEEASAVAAATEWEEKWDVWQAMREPIAGRQEDVNHES